MRVKITTEFELPGYKPGEERLALENCFHYFRVIELHPLEWKLHVMCDSDLKKEPELYKAALSQYDYDIELTKRIVAGAKYEIVRKKKKK